MSDTPRFHTKEAIEVARYIDTLPPDAREYAVGMVYRVCCAPFPDPEPGDEPPKRRGRGKVIELFPRRRSC